MTGRIGRPLAAAVVGLVALTGCNLSQGLYGASLPGSVGGGGYTVRAIFANVQDLVPQAAVKVADVTVGTVENIKLLTKPGKQFMTAEVDMHIEPSVRLPANSEAVLEQTSLLGEKFVQLGPPPGVAPATTFLPENGKVVFGLTSTLGYPNITQIFGALSFLLNGGGLNELETIDYELSQALSGREGDVRNLLLQLNALVGGLNGQKSQIVRALDNVDTLATQLAVQRGTIATALTDLGPGLKVLADERTQFVSLLQSLARLGQVSSRVIDASRAATQRDLTDLEPIVTRIAAAGASLPRALDLLVDYPFPLDSASAIPGDYTNLYATIELNGSLCTALPTAFISACNTLIGTVTGGLGGLPGLPGLPAASHEATKKGTAAAHSTAPLKLPIVNVPPAVGKGLAGLKSLLGLGSTS